MTRVSSDTDFGLARNVEIINVEHLPQKFQKVTFLKTYEFFEQFLVSNKKLTPFTSSSKKKTTIKYKYFS